jgi:hypothetical protein
MIGDHIRAMKDGRWTHAIDCGDRTVITLAADPELPPADRVCRLYRPAFEAGADAIEVVTHRERAFPPRQVVARAFSRTRDAVLAAMFQDSEQFAAWCKVGRMSQVPRNGVHAAPVLAPPAQPERRDAPRPGKVIPPKAAPKPAKTASKATAKVAAKPARTVSPNAAAAKPARKLPKAKPARKAGGSSPARRAAGAAKAAVPAKLRGAKKVAARKPAAKTRAPVRKVGKAKKASRR